MKVLRNIVLCGLFALTSAGLFAAKEAERSTNMMEALSGYATGERGLPGMDLVEGTDERVHRFFTALRPAVRTAVETRNAVLVRNILDNRDPRSDTMAVRGFIAVAKVGTRARFGGSEAILRDRLEITARVRLEAREIARRRGVREILERYGPEYERRQQEIDPHVTGSNFLQCHMY